MSRPSQIDEQRKRLLPYICEVFREFGYRGATTAVLAERCGVQENILYRLWPDKKAMFVAAIENIFQDRAERWARILSMRPTPLEAADALVSYEAKHQGEFGFYRVVFTALAEVEDPKIREVIKRMYSQFHKLIHKLINESREESPQSNQLSGDATAWALIGLATVSNIVRELDLQRPKKREKMFVATAKCLLRGESA